MSGDLIDTTEMYLRTVFELLEEGVEPLRARIVERLKQSGPTVSQTVGRLERDNLLTVENDRHLQFTEVGWERAINVMRKHRLAEVGLAKLGIEWEYLHDEACRLEHVMSDRLEKKLIELLGEPRVSPYGTPIPPMSGDVDPGVFRDGVLKLSDMLKEEHTVAGKLGRVSEFVQNDSATLAAISSETGMRPGLPFKARIVNDNLALAGPKGQVRIAPETADGIWVIKP
ncbi:metal-dependent transcriptional regulator [Propionimicrobium lymphophilum]|uniref:metal-dependent transcriptional regulator n=1 Tax=Propionimicrobium lymphophilum TaxID=33012 RepID=UPI0023F481FF|nr:metal-dependent transcriptional regulator [Propionimicrobium lymphophilum]